MLWAVWIESASHLAAATVAACSCVRLCSDDIEDLHDDMSDMLEDADEINEIMGRAYGSVANEADVARAAQQTLTRRRIDPRHRLTLLSLPLCDRCASVFPTS